MGQLLLHHRTHVNQVSLVALPTDISQIHRQMYGNDDIVDITGAQMVLVMKLTAFAWNVHDGRTARRSKEGLSTLADFQQESAILEIPDLLSYFAWVLFFPALFTGPAFEYAKYKSWLDCSLFNIDLAKNAKAAAKFKKGRKIPKSGRPALRRALEGLFWMGCFAYLDGHYRVTYVLSDEFLRQSWLYRFWYIVPLAFTHRVKYYGVWKLSEGGCILAGFGFNGLDKNGRLDWTSIENISPKDFETAQNTKALLEAWNKNTNKWLKNYIYLRVTPKGKKPGFFSTLATFATSAVWHGFYPGYYFAFATGAFAQTMGKYYRRNFRPFFLKADMTPAGNKYLYDILTWIVTQYTWAYIVQPFVVLSFMGSLTFWARYFFIIHVGMALNLAFFKSPLGAKLHRKKTSRESVIRESSSMSTIPGSSVQMEKEVDQILHK